MYSTPNKTLGDTPRKRKGVKMVLFYVFATTCCFLATYDLNVEAIFLQLGKADAAAS